jgi:hypothetical protein
MMKRETNGDLTLTIIYDLSKLDPQVRKDIENKPKIRKLFTAKPDKLLGVSGDAKTSKGEKLGFKTAILYMAPAMQSGEQLCPMAAIAQCDLACLFTAGRGAMAPVFFSRLRKALFWQQYREEFIALLKKEIANLYTRSQKDGDWELLVRLNGTTDIRWENYGIIETLPMVKFYDYTKIANRKNLPVNYDLTFSYSGVAAYLPFVKKAIAMGMRIAVVFRTRKLVEDMLFFKQTFLGLDIVDGDDTDVRVLDPLGVVVALYAKGKAKKDTTGFVVA